MVFAFMYAPSGMEMCIFGIIALLLFGNRLPSVARSLGGSFNAFKSGLKDAQDEVTDLQETVKDATRLDK